MDAGDAAKVFLIDASDREAAVRSLFRECGLPALSGKSVMVKANFNSADPFPASTHPDTLQAIVRLLQESGAAKITVAERSGMGDTRENLDRLGVFDLSRELGFEVLVLDEEPKENWVKIERSGTHWLKGFYISKRFLDADVVVQTCCLKTHRFGGHFTLSLKNSVGLVARRVPGGLYDYMGELHVSPFQRLMIAEINQHYRVDLVIMDGAKAFIDGGPDKGTEVEPGLMLASRDRVALDAVGIAILRAFGAQRDADTPIFELEQIRRAAELGVGVASATAVESIPLDEHGRETADRIAGILAQG